MTKDYPVPPVPLKSSGALFNTAAAKLGLTVVPGPLAIITKPYMGRAACVNCGICSGYGCQVRARSSSAVTMLPIAEKTGRCEIRVSSYVREISVDNSGRVTGVDLFRCPEARGPPEGQGGGPVGQRIGVARGCCCCRSRRVSRMAWRIRAAWSEGMLMFGNGVNVSALFEHPLNEYKGVISGAGIVDYVAPIRSAASTAAGA